MLSNTRLFHDPYSSKVLYIFAAQQALQGNCPSDPNAQTCLNDINGNTQCTAKDSPVGVVVACIDGVCDGSQKQTCVNGQMSSFTLNITISANTWRYDVGAYIAPSNSFFFFNFFFLLKIVFIRPNTSKKWLLL